MATTAANTAIKDRLAAVDSFHPATVNLFDGWLLDPGDVVTVQSGDDSYRVPVYKMDTTWKGSSRTEVQSTGSEKRPPPSALKRRSYGYGRAQAETEKELIRHRADIEKTDERILLWATEEEWDAMKADYVLHNRTQVEIIDDKFSARVTRTELDTTLNGYIKVTALSTEMGNVMASSDGTIVAASIATAINAQQGTSVVRISGDMVSISGNTKISDIFGVNQSGYLTVAGDIYQNGTIHPSGVSVADGGTVDFISGTAPLTYVSLSGSNVPNLLSGAAVANNTLTVSKIGGGSSFTIAKSGNDLVISDGTSSITFSKATTLSGVWGSGASGPTGVYTVTASPQGATNTTSLSPTGHWGNTADGETATTYYGVMKATINGGSTLYDARKYEISAASKLTTQTITPTSSQQTVTPPSGYIGFSSVTVEAGGGSVPPSSHIQVESGGHYAPSYSASGTQITSWVSTIRTAVNNSGYFYFDAWLSDNPSDKKRYYIKF